MLDLRNCDCMEMMRDLKDKSQHLIICDPPYFEVKGEFDFIWSSFEDYLKDVEKWAIEIKRILSDNGTLLWWGHAKKIAYTQIILDKYFSLCNSLVWRKTVCQTRASSFDDAMAFAPVTERILMYSSMEMDLTGLKTVEKEYIAPRNPFAIELKRARIKKGVSINAVAEYGKFYGNVNHGGAVTNWENGYNIPLKDQWVTLCYNLPIELKNYDNLRLEYDNLRLEYEDKRRTFNNTMKLEDVLDFDQESSQTGQHKHPTQKPPKLCRSLIMTCSKKGQNLFIPFLGSFVEAVEGFNFGLNVSGSELDKDYFEAGMKRVKQETAQVSMF